MAKSLAQRLIDAKNEGWAEWIRHPNDERAVLNGCYFDPRAADRIRNFYTKLLTLPRVGGEESDKAKERPQRSSGRKPFILLDWWYQEVLGPLYGWKRANHKRRYDKGFVTTGKKSGKSSVLAGLPLYAITADGEEDAEAYSTAVDRDQAGYIYKKASRMARMSKLASVLTIRDSQKRIAHVPSGSWFEAISSDTDSTEGLNPHLLISDEIHAWRDRSFFEALMYGDISREQPLFLMITTAGNDKENVGYEEYEFAKDLLNPNTELYSESHFAFIAEKSDEREWDDPEGWKEANPSLACGALGSIAKLQAKCEEAKKSPRKKRAFIRYICNRWVEEASQPWLNQDAWQECSKAPIPDHAGEPCWSALDLSSKIDLTAYCQAFKAEPFIDLLWWFWMPEEGIAEKEKRDRVPYRLWVEQGWIQLTPGSKIDYAYIRRTISGVTLDEAGKPNAELWPDRLCAKYWIKELSFDPWNSDKLITELRDYDGINCVEHRQGYESMNRPSKEFEARIVGRTIRHGGNPVATWMTRHCVVDTDPAGNIKPTKKKSRHRIDGIVAAVMATGRAVTGEVESIYATPGNMRL